MTDPNVRFRWQSLASWTAAILLAVVWLTAGLWKLSDLTGWQVRVTQLLVPRSLSFAAAFGLGTVETFAGIMLLVPAWRRWGAWLSGILLMVFMGYIGYHYSALTGEECTCFPWLERAIGPMFFVQDAALVLLAAAAGWWANPPRGLRPALASLASIAVLGAAWFAVGETRQPDAVGPATIVADGRELPIHEGRVFLYFYNPSCPHCFEAAQNLAKLDWQSTVVGLATQDPELGAGFFRDAGMKDVKLSADGPKLRQTFPFQDVPYAVALENGRIREKLAFFEEPELTRKLREIGFAR